MLKISATRLRTHLFDYLDKVAAGETIIIERNQQEVARLTSPQKRNWRTAMTITPRLLVPPSELLKPLDDVWSDYV